MARLREVLAEAATEGNPVYFTKAELGKEVRRREQERFDAGCGPVKTTVDLSLLQSLTAGKNSRVFMLPELSINKMLRIRLSAACADHFSPEDKLEILANRHVVAIRKNEKMGMAVTVEHKARGFYINRRAVWQELIALGWEAGTRVPLEWDEDQQIYWGRKPQGSDAGVKGSDNQAR